jgi:hypothetical protein
LAAAFSLLSSVGSIVLVLVLVMIVPLINYISNIN